MTRINKNHGGSYVVENGKTKKVEGTQEPKVAAPRDSKGKRLDGIAETENQKPPSPNSGAALSAVHGVGGANTGTKTKNERTKK